VAEDQLSRVFATLADPMRRDMVARLATGDATVGELAEPYDVSIQAVSQAHQGAGRCGPVSQTKDAQRRRAISKPKSSPCDEVDRANRLQADQRYNRPRRRLGRDAGRRANSRHRKPSCKEQHHEHTGSRYQVSIVADPKVPMIHITRDFDTTPSQLMPGSHRSRAVRSLGRA